MSKDRLYSLCEGCRPAKQEEKEEKEKEKEEEMGIFYNPSNSCISS